MGLADIIELDIDTPESLPDLGIYRLGLHIIQVFFAFLTFCIIIPVISIQGQYHGNSLGAPNYTLVVALFSMFMSVALALFPWVKYRNHLIPVRNFFLRPRTAVIFTGFFTLGWFAAMISMTAHANNEDNCSLDIELQKKDSSYAGAWMKQCNSSKAAAAFCWFSFFSWVSTVVCNGILLWQEKKIRHAESSAAAATEAALRKSESGSSYDEDARTIVDLDLDNKDKLTENDYDTMSSNNSQKEDLNQPSSPIENHPLPIPPLAPSIDTNGLNSPFISNVSPLNGVPIYDTPVPTNLVSSYNPHHNSPYSTPTTVVSPYYTQSPYQQPYVPYTVPTEQPFNNPTSLHRDPSLVYHPPAPHRSYHSSQPYPYN